MSESLILYTFIALVLFYVIIEVYRFRSCITGTIIEFCQPSVDIEAFLLSRLKIQLKNGNIIEAEAAPCTMCQGNFSIGDRVRLTKINEKYVIHLPLL